MNDGEWTCVDKLMFESELLSDHFWSAVNVFTKRPHVINLKLLAAEVVKSWENIPADAQLNEFLIFQNFCENEIETFLENAVKQMENISIEQKMDTQICKKQKSLNLTLVLRNLIPKQANFHSEILEAVVLDHKEIEAVFFPKKIGVLNFIAPEFPYKFKLVEKEIHLEVFIPKSFSESTMKSVKWLKEKVLPKIYKWCQNIPKQPVIPSLSLVPIKHYNQVLHHLKKKYAKKLVEIWPQYETTNPLKYVYEDISIAAYLITLWSEERKKLNLSDKQTFVDLGCGNGLLDYILSSEGHKGIGIDLRKRKIWDAYGPETQLSVKTFEPNDQQLYPEYDWIIGNHADELTPWIPVIAARSSYNMKVFLLPCCFYTFNGKYARSHQHLTQYQSYLNFIEALCVEIGFETHIDKLRIPSTKRICFVCNSRTYVESEGPLMEEKRKSFIDSFISTEKAESSNWIPDFVPRSSVETSRNCTHLDKKTLHSISMLIFDQLLQTEEVMCIERDSKQILWNRGGKITLDNLCKMLDSQVLELMKKQRGGIQTFLKNHHDIFKVENKVLQLRIPVSFEVVVQLKHIEKKTKEYPFKSKRCFFNFYHPQGCPVTDKLCRYSHDVKSVTQ